MRTIRGAGAALDRLLDALADPSRRARSMVLVLLDYCALSTL